MAKKNNIISHSFYIKPVFLLLRLTSFLPLKIIMCLPFAKKPRTRAVIICGDCVLLVKNTLGSRSWNLPGGGIHKNEDPKTGILRELREELNLRLEPKRIRRLTVLHAADIKERSDKILYVSTISLEEYRKLSLSFEISSLQLVKISDITRDRNNSISKCVVRSMSFLSYT